MLLRTESNGVLDKSLSRSEVRPSPYTARRRQEREQKQRSIARYDDAKLTPKYLLVDVNGNNLNLAAKTSQLH